MSIPAPETKIVTAWRVACDGGEGALGHPRVWLSIPRDKGWVECGYCDARYVHETAKDAAE
ncbi:zinc-finger domain-containing protein [Flavimaricola marinus]|uniref:Zinc-finger domain protein n=1 Tax=Flavimaricola marinus TaxID=1819565 RepID=A0A238L9E3_9RHOB|nr:zinc-finger domain-containing protein [Flavimaricola marinus]SMY06202.1 Zinc-finger domain protein [Flavimaricola marinus]